jgi:hypothetical protein
LFRGGSVVVFGGVGVGLAVQHDPEDLPVSGIRHEPGDAG